MLSYILQSNDENVCKFVGIVFAVQAQIERMAGALNNQYLVWRQL